MCSKSQPCYKPLDTGSGPWKVRIRTVSIAYVATRKGLQVTRCLFFLMGPVSILGVFSCAGLESNPVAAPTGIFTQLNRNFICKYAHRTNCIQSSCY